jgi:hypothetical protein
MLVFINNQTGKENVFMADATVMAEDDVCEVGSLDFCNMASKQVLKVERRSLGSSTLEQRKERDRLKGKKPEKS